MSNSFGVEHCLVLMRFNELISDCLSESLFERYRRDKAGLINSGVVNRVRAKLLDAYRADGKPSSGQ